VESRHLEGRPGWAELQAVRAAGVYVTDGNQYFNRPGPRLVESLEILAEILHPEAFEFGHAGVGWQDLTKKRGSAHRMRSLVDEPR
jgi:iron complex transport system substrate-binding protein